MEKYPDVPRDGRPHGFLNLIVSTGQREPLAVLDMNDEEQAADFQTFLGENIDLSNQADVSFHNLLDQRTCSSSIFVVQCLIWQLYFLTPPSRALSQAPTGAGTTAAEPEEVSDCVYVCLHHAEVLLAC